MSETGTPWRERLRQYPVTTLVAKRPGRRSLLGAASGLLALAGERIATAGPKNPANQKSRAARDDGENERRQKRDDDDDDNRNRTRDGENDRLERRQQPDDEVQRERRQRDDDDDPDDDDDDTTGVESATDGEGSTLAEMIQQRVTMAIPDISADDVAGNTVTASSGNGNSASVDHDGGVAIARSGDSLARVGPDGVFASSGGGDNGSDFVS